MAYVGVDNLKVPDLGGPAIVFSDLYARDMSSQLYGRRFPSVDADIEKQDEIKKEFQYAWNRYADKCFGHDELKPLSGTCIDRIAGGMTIVDAMSTMAIMDLKKEFHQAKTFLADSFHPKGRWSLFEYIIRFVGGFLSAYELTGDQLFLTRAVESADAIFPLIKDDGTFGPDFEFYYENDKLTAKGRGGKASLSDTGTYQLEFLKLTQLTGDPKYAEKALKLYRTIWKRNPRFALISTTNGQTYVRHVGGLDTPTDSYFEYILKSYLMTYGKAMPLLHQHERLVREVREMLLFSTPNATAVGMFKERKLIKRADHLSLFFPGLLVVGSVQNNRNATADVDLASQLTDGIRFIQQSTTSKLIPEEFELTDEGLSIVKNEYHLRPEAAESIYLLWKFTGLDKYREYAWDLFQGIKASCRSSNGYSSVRSLNSQNITQIDQMESYFLSETLMYLYLTFSDSAIMSPNEWVFNTEGHPLKIWDKETCTKYLEIIEMKDLEQIAKGQK